MPETGAVSLTGNVVIEPDTEGKDKGAATARLSRLLYLVALPVLCETTKTMRPCWRVGTKKRERRGEGDGFASEQFALEKREKAIAGKLIF